MNEPHPVRLVVEDDLQRNRLTVFFRLLLAIPHFIWIFLWSIAVVRRRDRQLVRHAHHRHSPPPACTASSAAYVRYQVHLSAYLYLVANPYPGFAGEEGTYPIDVRLPGAAARSRAGRPCSASSSRSRRCSLSPRSAGVGGASVSLAAARRPTYGGRRRRRARPSSAQFLGWFAIARARPDAEGPARRGRVRHRLRARRRSRMCCSSPTATRTPTRRRLLDDGRAAAAASGAPRRRRARSAPLAAHRLLPAAARDPALVWLALWTIAAIFVAIVNWFATLVRRHAAAGAPPLPLALRALPAARQRVPATSSANPFPGFAGAPGSYPLDLELPGAAAAEPLEDRLPDLPRDPGARSSTARSARRSSSRRSSPGSSRSSAARRRGGCATSRRTRCATRRR